MGETSQIKSDSVVLFQRVLLDSNCFGITVEQILSTWFQHNNILFKNVHVN